MTLTELKVYDTGLYAYRMPKAVGAHSAVQRNNEVFQGRT